MSEPSRNPSRGNQSPNWLNNTVKVGNNDVSMATVLLAVLGISFAFGTSWLTGIFSSIGLATLLVIIAVSIAYQNRDLGLVEMIVTSLTFFLVFKIALWFLSDYLPQTIADTDTSKWQNVTGEFSAASPDLFGDGWLAGNDPAPDSSGYIYATATPDPNMGGGAPVAAAVLTPAPTMPPTPAGPTPTLDAVVAMLPELNASVSAQNRVASRSVVDAILRLEPNNQRALEVQQQLDHVDELLRLRRGMPVQPSTTIDPVKAGYISSVLNGGQYQITDTGQGFLQRACKSVATIKETSGWLAGETYRVQLCLLDQFNVGKVGDEFTVNIGG